MTDFGKKQSISNFTDQGKNEMIKVGTGLLKMALKKQKSDRREGIEAVLNGMSYKCIKVYKPVLPSSMAKNSGLSPQQDSLLFLANFQ